MPNEAAEAQAESDARDEVARRLAEAQRVVDSLSRAAQDRETTPVRSDRGRRSLGGIP